jgi:N-methylhydantoinase A
VIDIHTVGAGGGSLARVDPGGALRVGPESAGADPGPICYGRGGTVVTVTDAHVWLGRLPAGAFLGGERSLDRERIRGPLGELARALGATPEEAAEGVVEVADSAMERALRVISVERGFDPADFAVLAFGGAGGLHVAELTLRLGAARALVPPDPGLLSAYGMLVAPPTREVSRTVLLVASAAESTRALAEAFVELEAKARAELIQEGAADELTFTERSLDVRYRGQSFELRVPADDWVEAFHAAHESRYGYARRGAAVEAVTLRAVARCHGPPLDPVLLDDGVAPPKTSSGKVRHQGRDLDVTLLWRQELRGGHRLAGPVVVQEYSATTWVPPRWTLEVDRWGTLHLLPPNG